MEDKYFLAILDKIEDAMWEDPNLSDSEINKVVRILNKIDDSEEKRIVDEIRSK